MARAQKLLDDLEDASNELMITDDTEASAAARAFLLSVRACADAARAARQVRYVVGGSFVTVPNDDAETRLQSGAPASGSTRGGAAAHRAALCSDGGGGGGGRAPVQRAREHQ